MKSTQTLAKSTGIKGLKNSEHILLKHIQDNRFKLMSKRTGQSAEVQMTVKK